MQQAPLDFTPVQWASTDVAFSLVRHALAYVHNLAPSLVARLLCGLDRPHAYEIEVLDRY